MEREQIHDVTLEEVVGGSIVFNGDNTTCGRNCNNQYRVVDYDQVIAYIANNCTKMSEKTMINNMLDAGLLEYL